MAADVWPDAYFTRKSQSSLQSQQYSKQVMQNVFSVCVRKNEPFCSSIERLHTPFYYAFSEWSDSNFSRRSVLQNCRVIVNRKWVGCNVFFRHNLDHPRYMRLYPDERLSLIAVVSFIPIIENLHCWSAKVQITYLQRRLSARNAKFT